MDTRPTAHRASAFFNPRSLRRPASARQSQHRTRRGFLRTRPTRRSPLYLAHLSTSRQRPPGQTPRLPRVLHGRPQPGAGAYRRRHVLRLEHPHLTRGVRCLLAKFHRRPARAQRTRPPLAKTLPATSGIKRSTGGVLRGFVMRAQPWPGAPTPANPAAPAAPWGQADV